MPFDPTSHWYRSTWHVSTLFLLPFSWLFAFCTTLRRWLYRKGILKKYQFSVPVVVVGNITVGGTGKTPFVIWLVKWLQDHGFHPGIVSRGVGGKKHRLPHRVKENDGPSDVGDEALLLKRKTNCSVVICVDRVKAVRDLLHDAHCDIVISDDGLQHYGLGRDIEIALIDAVRGVGNQCLLPAGPLREPPSRLKEVDFVVVNGENDEAVSAQYAPSSHYTMSYIPTEVVSLHRPQQKMSLADFASSQNTVHAVAGIGHPERFFTMLRQTGLKVIPHVFSDHYLYQAKDFHFADAFPIIMTEKDAVKCEAFMDTRFWYLRIAAKMNLKLEQALLSRLGL